MMSLPRRARPFLVLTVLLLLTPAAGAATYYVDENGDDAGPGTLAAPFATITRGLNSIKGPGDILLVRGGTYRERAVIWEKHGARDRPIYIGAYEGERPIIDGTNIGPHSTVSIHTSSHVIFDGFTVRNSPRNGILIWNAHHITVQYNTVETAIAAGIHASADLVGGTHDVMIRNNTVRDTVRHNRPGLNPPTWLQAVSSYRAKNVTFTKNYVYENYGEGIDCVVSDHCTITSNTIRDNRGAGIYLDNAQHSLVDGNFIYNTLNREYFRNGNPSPGIAVANETYPIQNPATHLTITNNIVRGCNVGFVYYNSQHGGGMHETLIANNTFYESQSTTAGLIYIEDGTTKNVHGTTIIENNIFVQKSGVRYARAPTAGITWRTNNWYGGRPGTQIAGTGDLSTNPMFAKPGGWTAADYKLTPASPLQVRTGGTKNGLHDHWATPRTPGYSLGAHELD